MINRYDNSRDEIRKDFEREREEMRNEFEVRKRKMTITFWKFVISSMAIFFLVVGYMIYRYGHIVTELYDSLIIYLNK